MHPFLFSFLVLAFIFQVRAAITTPINRNGDFVEQNSRGDFCYYPRAVDPANIDVACVGGSKGDFAAVMQAHLNQTSSINYFSGSLERLGGPEWVFNARGRKIYLCLSGRAGDFTYQTMCTNVSRDNSLGNSTTPFCKVQTGQRRVTDGCYVPNQPAPTLTVASTPRPAVTTITRTSAATTRTASNSLSTSPDSDSETSGAQHRLGESELHFLAMCRLTFRVTTRVRNSWSSRVDHLLNACHASMSSRSINHSPNTNQTPRSLTPISRGTD